MVKIYIRYNPRRGFTHPLVQLVRALTQTHYPQRPAVTVLWWNPKVTRR